jgi:polar amino acid transport system substrate-binding protein
MAFSRVLGLLILFVFVGHTVQARNCPRSYRVGVVYSEPIYFITDTKKIHGVGYDIVEELRRRTGCDFQIIELSRPSVVERIRSSAIDMSVLSIKTDAMDAVASFIPSHQSYRAVAFASKFKGEVIKQAFEDKKVIFGSVIGNQGYYRTEEINHLRLNNRLKEFPDYRSLYMALKDNKVHAAVSSVMMNDYFITKLGFKKDLNFVIDETTARPVGTYYNKQRFSAYDQDLIREAYEGMMKDGTMGKIYRKYVSEAATKNSLLKIPHK